MSTSETHSEKATSDDEDFKTNIPFFDGANSAAAVYTHSKSYESLGRNTEGGSDDDDDDANSFNYSNWDNDDAFLDGNGIRVGESLANYSSASMEYGQVHENDNFFETTSPTGSTGQRVASPASVTYHDDATQEIKYSPPNDLILRPPSNSTAQYNYNYPQPPSPRQEMQPPPPHTRAPHLQPHLHPHSHPPTAQTAAQYGAYAHQHAPGSHHPNMWYPNAPYGTGPYYRQYGGSHRYSHYNAGGGYHHSHDHMMDMLQLSNSGREARNRAEKNRRDKLNGSIQELSTMVPHVAESPRRVDKTAVLRFAAHGLRLQYVFSETLQQQRPQVTDQLMKLLDSFFITITCHGQIVLISSSIEQHLGHCQADLYGQNILHITHPEDHNMLKQQLIPTDLESLFDIQPDDDSGEPRCRTQAEEEYIDKRLREDKRSFTVRLARAGPRSEPTTYEVVKLDGNFRRADSAPRGIKSSTFSSSLQLIRRSRGRDDAIPLHTISGNDIVLVAIARIIRPPKIINCVMEANALEYKTRHLIDGRIIDCDQRIGLVAGYMTDEVRNLSPFTFMHQDDVRWVIVALRQMYDCNSSYGESTYRLFTRNGNFIYLQSKGYLEIDKDTNNVHSFVCVNTLLNEEEGQRRVQEMKDKFSIIINKKIPQSSVDVPASENPQQLEKAVLCLIQNLHKSSDYDEDVDTSPPSSYTDEFVSHGGIYPSGSGSSSSATAMTLPTSTSSSSTAAMRIRSNMSVASSSSVRSTKTPPLALVPPEASSVKISISNSVNVVNVNAAKHLRCNQREKSPLPMDEAADEEETRYNLNLNVTNVTDFACSICQGTSEDCKYCQNISNRISSSPTAATGIKRSISCSKESHDVKLSKRRLKSTEIEHALTSSLSQLDRKLGQQFNAAIELRDQINKYEVPNSNQRIDEILEEHQKQTEIYGYIKSEYKVQMQKKKVIDINTTKTSTTTRADPQTENDDDDKLS